MNNKALRLHRYGPLEADTTWIDDIPDPVLRPVQVLVDVAAAAINPLDWKIRDGLMRDSMPLELPAVLGLELSGRVVDAGDHEIFRTGDRVMGPVGGVGAYALRVAVDAAHLCLTPPSLEDTNAAAVPVAIQTAYQLVKSLGDIKNRRILIHGASGSVGSFAVQMAAAAGAVIYATASTNCLDHVRNLGAAVVIDYRHERFEDRVTDIDDVIDLVGGETLNRSWGIVRRGGTIVSTVMPDIAHRAPAHVGGQFFNMQCDGVELARLAHDVAAGRLVSQQFETCAFDAIPEAIERIKHGQSVGKIVAHISEC